MVPIWKSPFPTSWTDPISDSKLCPGCGLINPSTSKICDCGYGNISLMEENHNKLFELFLSDLDTELKFSGTMYTKVFIVPGGTLFTVMAYAAYVDKDWESLIGGMILFAIFALFGAIYFFPQTYFIFKKQSISFNSVLVFLKLKALRSFFIIALIEVIIFWAYLFSNRDLSLTNIQNWAIFIIFSVIGISIWVYSLIKLFGQINFVKGKTLKLP